MYFRFLFSRGKLYWYSIFFNQSKGWSRWTKTNRRLEGFILFHFIKNRIQSGGHIRMCQIKIILSNYPPTAGSHSHCWAPCSSSPPVPQWPPGRWRRCPPSSVPGSVCTKFNQRCHTWQWCAFTPRWFLGTDNANIFSSRPDPFPRAVLWCRLFTEAAPGGFSLLLQPRCEWAGERNERLSVGATAE